jgi:hypothetical protein
MLTLLDFENAILDLFEDNRIHVQDVLWIILTAIYNNELVEEPERREIIINNIERQKAIIAIPSEHFAPITTVNIWGSRKHT